MHLRARDDDARLPRHHAGDVVADLLDVFGRRAATAAHEARARFDHAPRIARHVLGRCEVDLAVADILGQTGVRLRRDRFVGRLDHLFDGLEEARRPDRAIHADHIRAPGGELLGECLRIGAVVRQSIRADRHLADDREIGCSADRIQCRVHFVHVAERFEHEPVHAAREQPRYLASE